MNVCELLHKYGQKHTQSTPGEESKTKKQNLSPSPKERLKKNEVNVLECLSQSFDLIKMWWKDLKRAVHLRKPTSCSVQRNGIPLS